MNPRFTNQVADQLAKSGASLLNAFVGAALLVIYQGLLCI